MKRSNMIRCIHNRLNLIITIFIACVGLHLEAANIEARPKVINMGDEVSIEVTGYKEGDRVSIGNPLGNVFETFPNNQGIVKFSDTDDPGFLTADWNKYSVSLIRGNSVADTSSFMIATSDKEIYFSVYADDVGETGFIDKENYEWFKSIGGKLNIGYMNDDWGLNNLNKVRKKYKDDFIYHHFHAQYFSGPRIVANAMKLIHSNHFTGLLLYDWLKGKRVVLIALILAIVMVLVWKLKVRRRRQVILIGAIFLILATSIYGLKWIYLNHRFFKIGLDDPHWCKQFLSTAQDEFEQNGMPYPRITRHGWNVPPPGLQFFYLTEMGVLADASLNYPIPSSTQADPYADHGYVLNQVFKFNYAWPSSIPKPVPFYSDLRGEINTPWRGGEENRGLVQLPISNYNFGGGLKDSDHDKQIVDSAPNGALISVWGHTRQDFKLLLPLMEHIRSNYSIRYVTANEYLDVYMSHFPRPVAVDAEGKAFWALPKDKHIHFINECNFVSVSGSRIISTTASHPPFLYVHGSIEARPDDKYIGIGREGEYLVYEYQGD